MLILGFLFSVYTPEQLVEKYGNITFLLYCVILILVVALHHSIYRLELKWILSFVFYMRLHIDNSIRDGTIMQKRRTVTLCFWTRSQAVLAYATTIFVCYSFRCNRLLLGLVCKISVSLLTVLSFFPVDTEPTYKSFCFLFLIPIYLF